MEDYKFVSRWSEDEEFCKANGWESNKNERELYEWWLRCVNDDVEDFIRMGIEMEERMIGYVDLADIKNNSAEIGIAIGERSLWGRGIGTKSILLLLEYAVKNFGITTFYAETHEANIRSRRMLEKMGFKEMSRNGKEVYYGSDNQLLQYMLKIQ